MELKFIWVTEYRIIKNLGFNFNHSGAHRFSFSGSRLILLPNEKGVLDFGRNITGITAIAGENGSGKSSLCEISLLTTATRVNGAFGVDIEFDGIVCYGNHIFYHKDIEIENTKELESAGYIPMSFQTSPLEVIDLEERNAFNEGGFVYYSNVLDLRSDFSAMNLANISTQNYIREDYKYSTYHPSVNPYSFEPDDDVKNKDQQDPIKIYYTGQGYRSTKFYVNFPSFIPFAEPKKFIIKSSYSDNNRWINLKFIKNFQLRLSYENIQNQIFQVVYQYNSVSQSEAELEIEIDPTLYKKAIHQLYKFNLVVALSVISHKFPDASHLADFIFNDQINGVFEKADSIMELVRLHELIVSLSSTYEGKFKAFSTYYHYKNLNDWRFVLLENILLDNSTKNRLLLRDFIDLEEKVLSIEDKAYRRITNYSLSPQLSSGESSFMNFFSRLNDVIHRYTRGSDDRKNLILFIDEAEIGFHPEWSKQFLKWLLDFLNNYTSGYKFQLILTTHSPYLLSDLASHNILLLRKGLDHHTEIVPSDTFKTFGSNIHELLAESFFMREGFMGDFAKEKIEELIEFLNGKNSNFDEASSLKLISLIGDDIISLRLKDLHAEKFKTADVSQTEAEYKLWLQSELDRLNLNES